MTFCVHDAVGSRRTMAMPIALAEQCRCPDRKEHLIITASAHIVRACCLKAMILIALFTGVQVASDRRSDSTLSTSATTVVSTLGPTCLPLTTGPRMHKDQLAQALDNLRQSHPPQLFAKRYQLLHERVSGGQAVIQVCDSRPRLHEVCPGSSSQFPLRSLQVWVGMQYCAI